MFTQSRMSALKATTYVRHQACRTLSALKDD